MFEELFKKIQQRINENSEKNGYDRKIIIEEYFSPDDEGVNSVPYGIEPINFIKISTDKREIIEIKRKPRLFGHKKSELKEEMYAEIAEQMLLHSIFSTAGFNQ